MILSNNNEYIINYSLRSLSYSGGGCDYNNKYEIPTYGSKSRDKIQIRVRHYQDSYIAAEEITKGCSSTNIYETNCISNTVSETNTLEHQHKSNGIKLAIVNKYTIASENPMWFYYVCVAMTASFNLLIILGCIYLFNCDDIDD